MTAHQFRSSKLASRILMIELDAVSLPFIRANLGFLPNFRRLLKEGAVVQTDGPAHIASASVWPTFSSGKQPGHHGHYFPFQWNAEKMSFFRTNNKIWANSIDFEPFWYDVARSGIKSVILDATQVMEHTDSPCLEIINWSAQSCGQAFSSDPQVLKELRHRFGRRPIGAEVPVPKTRRMAEAVRSRSIRAMRKKVDAIIWLATSQDWQLFLGSIQEVHRAGHNLWPSEGDFASDVSPDAMLDVYRTLDRQIERILKAVATKNTAVLFFSLNGMAANRAQNHFLPDIMNRLNALYVSGQSAVNNTHGGRGVIARLRNRVPPILQHAAVELLGEQVQDWVVNRENVGGRDWSATPAFPVHTGGEGMIRLNIKGRERDGYLDDNDGAKRQYIEWLRDRLMAIKVGPTDEPLISEFNLMHETFSGPRSRFLPDISLQWGPDQPAEEIYSKDIGVIRAKLRTGRGGNHTGESFAILAGEVPFGDSLSHLRHIADYSEFVRHLLNQAPAHHNISVT